MKPFLAVLPVLLLAACETDALAGVMEGWHMTGANAANLAAMAARPSDLVSGRDGPAHSGLGDARQALIGIDRIWQDQPKALPEASKSSGGSKGGG
jgi:type IV pilus biogenesis protein CpaD/CtpE